MHSFSCFRQTSTKFLADLTTEGHGTLLSKVEKVPRRGNMFAAGFHGSMEKGKTVVAYAPKHTHEAETQYAFLVFI